ncbi:uncharacterized protein H6S33_011982 [Morchella sextelata]|uniref:uncharacterized protein n=1 Tax=Morchella sextelata TaxID=1174677 RepID=UPI001D050A6F|nr:uncharacterized protein H6S33_011982 [Morchella sextelata]KAH0610455.1 hypothetical protein H6S33_011982 [Morchella sextelata]
MGPVPTFSKRLKRELLNMQKELPAGIHIAAADDLSTWEMDLEVLDQNPIYYGKTFRLRFKFGKNYPIEPPEVMFVRTADREIPMHPHVYSNGIICLDLLSTGHGWSPVQNVESVCVSIQSMLTGNTKNERPEGDSLFVMTPMRSVRDINFVYDDPTV